MISIGIGEVGSRPKRLLHQPWFLEYYAPRLKGLIVFATVARLEDQVVASRVLSARRPRINDIIPFHQDVFEVLSLVRDRQPSGVAGLLRVLHLYETKDFSVEFQSPLLVADDNWNVS